MAYNIINIGTPSAGGVRVGDISSGANRVARAIEQIKKVVDVQSARTQKKLNEQSVLAAQRDIVYDAVDPNRARNDGYYSATVTRNEVNNEVNRVMADLDSDTSAVSLMDPDEFQKYLNKRTKEFYQGNTGKYAELNAGIFNKHMLANQPKLIAKHAAGYRERIKKGQEDAAIVALSTISPDMDEKFFDKNTDALIKQVLPEDAFTKDERLQHIMAAATNGAMNGDTRLLDYAKKNLNADELARAKVKIAEDFHRKWRKNDRKAHWNNQYKMYEELAQSGQFTKAEWDSLIINQEAIDNLGGRGQIDSWLRAGSKARLGAATIEKHTRQFQADYPMEDAQPKDLDAVIDHITANAAAAGRDQTATMQMIATKMGTQNLVSPNMKRMFQSALGRQIWTPAVANNEQFQSTFMMAKMLSDNMSPDQLKRQLGDDAYDAFHYIDGEMQYNGGNFESAITSYSQATQERKKRGLDKHLSSEEHQLISDGVDAVMSGDVETSDPTMTKFFGMVSKANNAMFTSGLKADITNISERYMLRGWRKDLAIEQATRVAAANYGQFGGEVHYTGGASVGVLFGLAPGASESEMDKSWDFYVRSLGKDPKEVAPHLVNGMLTLVNRKTGEESAAVPAETLGELWNAHKIEQAAQEAEQEESEKMAAQQEVVDRVQNNLYRVFGEDNATAEWTTYQGEPITIHDFEMADLPLKMEYVKAWRRDNFENGRKLAQMFRTAGEFWGSALKSAKGWLSEHIDTENVVVPGEGPVEFSRSVEFQPTQVEAAEMQIPAEEGVDVQEEQIGTQAAPKVVANSPAYITTLKKKATPWRLSTHKQYDITGADTTSHTLKGIIGGHERAVGVPYLDVNGIMTIGIGHNIEANPFDAEETARFGKDRDWFSKPMTKEEADWLLDRDINRMKSLAPSTFKTFRNVSANRKDAMLMLLFNIGPGIKSGMPGAWKALNEGRWDDAAGELKYYNGKDGRMTKWYRDDVKPARGDYIINLIKKG